MSRENTWIEGTLKPRERLLQLGAQALSDHELVAILLRTGVKNKNVLQSARELLAKMGGIRGLLNANDKDLLKHKGLGNAKLSEILAVREINKRYLSAQIKKEGISNPQDLREYLKLQLTSELREVFACIFLDIKNQVLDFKKLFFGSISQAEVHPREIAKLALEINCSSVILVHNHPSGNCQPSVADRLITNKIKQSLKLFDIAVHDHIIVCVGDSYSFAENNLL